MADRNTVIRGNQIKDATVTEAELSASVAGAGLAGGAGTPLSVNVDNSTVEVNGDTVRVKALGITNAEIANDTILEVKLDATNAPTDGYLLSYDQATGGFTWVQSPAVGAIVEADIAKDDFSATLNGVLTDFELTSIPVTASLQVFINGVLAQEGSGKDYQLNPDSGMTKTIRILGDVLATGEKLIVHYVINN